MYQSYDIHKYINRQPVDKDIEKLMGSQVWIPENPTQGSMTRDV